MPAQSIVRQPRVEQPLCLHVQLPHGGSKATSIHNGTLAPGPFSAEVVRWFGRLPYLRAAFRRGRPVITVMPSRTRVLVPVVVVPMLLTPIVRCVAPCQRSEWRRKVHFISNVPQQAGLVLDKCYRLGQQRTVG